jgi:hypothetical protein
MTAVTAPPDARTLADRFIAYVETGQAPPDLYAPDVFVDLTVPQWRLQASGRDAALAVRSTSHPEPSRVPRHRFDPTPTGFVLEWEETWTDAHGEQWYCREMMRADVGPEGITALSVYCTGDWDTALVARHAAEVTLIRP